MFRIKPGTASHGDLRSSPAPWGGEAGFWGWAWVPGDPAASGEPGSSGGDVLAQGLDARALSQLGVGI